MLHDDITVVSDGGGRIAAFRNIIAVRDNVTRLLLSCGLIEHR